MVLVPIRNKSDVPENYTFLPTNKAKEEQWNLMYLWEPRSEVWPILYGDRFIAALGALNSVVINTMFRRKLKLRANGLIITNVYAIIGGGAFSGHFFRQLVTEELLMYKPQCFSCLELKAILATNFVSVIFPALTFPALCLGLAGNTGLRVPYWTEGREIWKFWWSVIKPGLPHLSALCIANAVAVSIIAYKQATAMNNVAEVIWKVDKHLKETQYETSLE